MWNALRKHQPALEEVAFVFGAGVLLGTGLGLLLAPRPDRDSGCTCRPGCACRHRKCRGHEGGAEPPPTEKAPGSVAAV